MITCTYTFQLINYIQYATLRECFTLVCYEYVAHNLLEIWAKCEELRIITEIKYLRTGYFQNRSYGNYSFIDLIGEKSHICGKKKEGRKKEGRKEGRTRELCSRTQTHLHLTKVLCAVLWPVFPPSSSSCRRFCFPLHNRNSHSPEHMCSGDALRVERPTRYQCWLDCISTRLSHQFICVSIDDTLNVRLCMCYVIMLPN